MQKKEQENKNQLKKNRGMSGKILSYPGSFFAG